MSIIKQFSSCYKRKLGRDDQCRFVLISCNGIPSTVGHVLACIQNKINRRTYRRTDGHKVDRWLSGVWCLLRSSAVHLLQCVAYDVNTEGVDISPLEGPLRSSPQRKRLLNIKLGLGLKTKIRGRGRNNNNNRRNTQSSTAVTFLSRLQLRSLVFSTPQPTACWSLTWRFLWTQGNQGRPVSYTSAFQC